MNGMRSPENPGFVFQVMKEIVYQITEEKKKDPDKYAFAQIKQGKFLHFHQQEKNSTLESQIQNPTDDRDEDIGNAITYFVFVPFMTQAEKSFEEDEENHDWP